MKKKQTKKITSSNLTIEYRRPSILEVADQLHHTVTGYCEYCGRAMTPSDVNDYGSLCQSCYLNEYYND